MGQLSADLFACRVDQLCRLVVQALERHPMSRLIVISNRVSAPKAQSAAGAQGGLSVALSAALKEYRGIRFGWSGEQTEEFTGHMDLPRQGAVNPATIAPEATTLH